MTSLSKVEQLKVGLAVIALGAWIIGCGLLSVWLCIHVARWLGWIP